MNIGEKGKPGNPKRRSVQNWASKIENQRSDFLLTATAKRRRDVVVVVFLVLLFCCLRLAIDC